MKVHRGLAVALMMNCGAVRYIYLGGWHALSWSVVHNLSPSHHRRDKQKLALPYRSELCLACSNATEMPEWSHPAVNRESVYSLSHRCSGSTSNPSQVPEHARRACDNLEFPLLNFAHFSFRDSILFPYLFPPQNLHQRSSISSYGFLHCGIIQQKLEHDAPRERCQA